MLYKKRVSLKKFLGYIDSRLPDLKTRKKQAEELPAVSSRTELRSGSSQGDSIPKDTVSNKMCGECGRTSQQLIDFFEKARLNGAVVISLIPGAPDDGLLYCNNCKKYFCGRCQIDLGVDSGCPICKKALVVKK
jgi:uncharacterized protein YbaR (Trm112 family)